MITENLIKEIQEELKEKFKEIEEKYGVTLRFKESSYTNERADMKLILEEGAEDLLKSRKDYYLQVCSYMDLEKDWFGKTFKDRNQELQFLGIDRTKRKNCIILKGTKTGDEYRASAEYLREHLA